MNEQEALWAATEDMLLYGTGAVMIVWPGPRFVHIPVEEIPTSALPSNHQEKE